MQRKLWLIFLILSVASLAAALLTGKPPFEWAGFSPAELQETAITEFEATQKPLETFSLKQLPQFAIDRTLLDPTYALPHFDLYNFASMAEFSKAESTCRDIENPLLNSLPHKFTVWLQFKCGKSAKAPENFLSEYPFMHPNGSSFAALLNEPRDSPYRHALEGEAQKLTPELLLALTRESRLALTEESVWINSSIENERDSAGGAFRIYNRKIFENYIKDIGLTVSEGWPVAIRFDGRRKGIQNFRQKWIGVSLSLIVLLLLVALAQLLLGRREDSRRRKFSFQLLAHELRTPVAVLKIEMDEILSHYDELPAWAQEKHLRLANNLERLNQVVRASESYVRNLRKEKFFSTAGGRIDSLKELIEKTSENFSKEVRLDLPNDDVAVELDTYWVGFCLSNLVGNAVKYGKAPVEISFSVSEQDLIITVTDQGALDGDPRRKDLSASTDGLGIGLGLVDRVTRELGGTLEFSSAPTTWTLNFKKVIR